MTKPVKVRITTAIFSIAAIIAVGASYAYFTDADKAVNELNAGGVRTGIEEEFPDPGGYGPGESILKKVQIKNTGTSDCYVRVQVLFSDSEMEDLCTLDYDTAHWTRGTDGWWYYNDILKADQKTRALFSSVRISSSAKVSDLHRFDIIVRQESRQQGGHLSAQAAFS